MGVPGLRAVEHVPHDRYARRDPGVTPRSPACGRPPSLAGCPFHPRRPLQPRSLGPCPTGNLPRARSLRPRPTGRPPQACFLRARSTRHPHRPPPRPRAAGRPSRLPPPPRDAVGRGRGPARGAAARGLERDRPLHHRPPARVRPDRPRRNARRPAPAPGRGAAPARGLAGPARIPRHPPAVHEPADALLPDRRVRPGVPDGARHGAVGGRPDRHPPAR